MRWLTIILCLVALGGCAHPWQTAHQGLALVQATNNAASRTLAELRPRVVTASREAVLDQYRVELEEYQQCREGNFVDCTDPGSPEIWTDRWQERMDAFEAAVDATYTLDDVLVETSQEVVRWSEEGDQETPAVVLRSCESISAAMRVVLAALRRFEIDYPAMVDQAQAVLVPVCHWGVSAFTGGDDDE